MAVLKLAISSARDDSTLEGYFETAGGSREIGNRIVNYVSSVVSGNESAMSSSIPPQIAISIQENEVRASATVTFSDHATANDTIIINGVTFTAKATGAGANEFNVGVSATASATNFAAAVNASVTALVAGYVTASSALGVVTVTSVFYGLAGNQATIAAVIFDKKANLPSAIKVRIHVIGAAKGAVTFSLNSQSAQVSGPIKGNVYQLAQGNSATVMFK